MSRLNTSGHSSQSQTAVRTPAKPKKTKAPPRSEGSRTTSTASRSELSQRPLTELRGQEPALPQGQSGQATLNRQGQQAEEALGTPITDPSEIVNQELKAAGLEEQFSSLTADQRERFLGLAQGLVHEGTEVNPGGQPRHPSHERIMEMTPEERRENGQVSAGNAARGNLMNLLREGDLTRTDSRGNTMLSNLERISQAEYPDGVEARQVLHQTLGSTGFRTKGMTGHTGHATSPVQVAAQADPAEFSRITHDIYANGQATLANGDTIKPPEPQPGAAAPMSPMFGGGFGGAFNPAYGKLNGALTEYGNRLADDPEVTASFNERVRTQLQPNDEATRAYQALTPEQRERTERLATNPHDRAAFALAGAFGAEQRDPLVNQGIVQLLGDGKLTGTDSQGRTLIDNLESIRGSGDEAMMRTGTYQQTVNHLANPDRNLRQRTWTTSEDHRLLREQPAEYARLIDGLTSGDNQVTTADGRTLSNPPPDTGGQRGFGFGFTPVDSLLRSASVRNAVDSGRPLEMINSNGENFDVRFRRTGTDGDGTSNYRMTLDGQSVNISSESGVADVENSFGELANFHSMTPKHLRGELSRVNFLAGDNPADPYWERTYGIEDFKSAATAGDHTINFYQGTSNLQEEVFNHEMGHLIGARRGILDSVAAPFNGMDDRVVPVGWQGIARDDGNQVSDYGSKSIQEDFAESWRFYMRARTEGASELREFRLTYPNRAELLERIHNDGDTW